MIKKVVFVATCFCCFIKWICRLRKFASVFEIISSTAVFSTRFSLGFYTHHLTRIRCSGWVRAAWIIRVWECKLRIKQGAQSLRMKIVRNSELYLRGATVIYCLQPLTARLLELALKLKRLDCSHASTLSRGENIRARFQMATLRVSNNTKLSRFTSLRQPEIATKQTSATTLHVILSVLWKFLQK